MTINNMFEVAAKTKMRFNFKGLISVEDLFDLSVENLDSIFKGLNSQLKQVKEESLLSTKSKEDKELDTKIEIVKYIVTAKLEEQASKLKSKGKSAKKQQLLELLNTKQNEELNNKSPEEILKMLQALEQEE